MSGLDLIIEPDEEESEAAEILMDGTIEGCPYRFLLDISAARSSLIFDDFTSSFDCIEKSDSSGVFAAGRQDVMRVPLIEIGPLSKKDFPLVRLTANDSQRPNLIGMDLLKDSCCHFFFDEKRMVIQDEPEDDWPFHEFIVGKKFHPYLAIQFEKLNTRAVWDTGAGITVVDMNWIRKNPAFFQQGGQAQGTDSAGTTMKTPMFMMASTVIGSHEFPPQKVAGVDLSHVHSTTVLPMDVILGYSTLRHANWVFDFPHERWAISKRVSGQ
jgi:hypothetical protein